MTNDCLAEQAAVDTLERKLADAQNDLNNAPAQKDIDAARRQIKDMEDLIAKYKDTKGYRKRIKEWKAEIRKNIKKLDKAIEPIKPLTRAIDKIGRELGKAKAALERCEDEQRERAERPHDFSGAQCWCGSSGMHGGQPR